MIKKLNSWLKQSLTSLSIAKARQPVPVIRRDAQNSLACLPFIHIEEVDDAAPFAGKLFLQKFKHPIPDYPRHFIAFHESSPGLRTTVGYVHFSPFENVFLGGGMCIDTAAYRRMSPEQMINIREVGSLAEHMLRNTLDMLGPCAAIFGSVGDATARVVDLRAGFVDTGVPNLMVVWRDVAESEKAAILTRVAALGAF